MVSVGRQFINSTGDSVSWVDYSTGFEKLPGILIGFEVLFLHCLDKWVIGSWWLYKTWHFSFIIFELNFMVSEIIVWWILPVCPCFWRQEFSSRYHFSGHVHLIFSNRVPPRSLELNNLTSLTGQRTPEILLSQYLPCWDYKYMPPGPFVCLFVFMWLPGV